MKKKLKGAQVRHRKCKCHLGTSLFFSKFGPSKKVVSTGRVSKVSSRL